MSRKLAASQGAASAVPIAPRRPQWRSIDITGNVRLLTSEELAEATKAAAAKAAAAKAAATKAAAAKAAAAKPGPGRVAKTIPAKASPAAARPASPAIRSARPAAGSVQPAISERDGGTEPLTPAPSPPIPGYGDLSLASLRARLRGLSVYQLIQLVDYEKSHANREAVVTLFERRIIKLGTGEPGSGDARPDDAQHPQDLTSPGHRDAEDTMTPRP